LSDVLIEPPPTDEEAAAIIAVLDSLRQEEERPMSMPSRWKLSGRDNDDDP
jgi:hypothetical protein